MYIINPRSIPIKQTKKSFDNIAKWYEGVSKQARRTEPVSPNDKKSAITGFVSRRRRFSLFPK
jgi:hypothetical protein